MGIPIWAVGIALFAFGWVYDIFVVSRMNGNLARRHPLTAVQVVFGVLVTIGGAWLVDGDCISLSTLLLCFAASGFPMVAGDITRWYENKR